MNASTEVLLNAPQIPEQVDSGPSRPPELKLLMGRAALSLSLAVGAGAAVGVGESVLEPHPDRATATTTFSNSYPNGDAHPYNVANYDWSVDENGNGIYEGGGELLSGRGYGYRNCTDGVTYWVSQYIPGVTIPNNWGNGEAWETSAQNAGYTVYAGNSNNIEPGDIAQSDDGSVGHVGFVTGVTKDANGAVTSITTAELNAAGDGNFTSPTYSSKNASGNFIRPGTNRDYDHFIDLNGLGKGLNNEDLNAPADPLRIGAVYTNGGFIVKETTPYTGWHTESNDSVTQIMQSGKLTGMVKAGALYVKSGDLDGVWNTQAPGDVISASISDAVGTTPIRIGVLSTNGGFYVREGLNGPWINEYSANVAQGYVSGNRIGVRLTDGTLLVKEGLYGGWVTENGNVSKAVLSGDMIGAVIGGTLYVKQGTLDAGWVTEQGGVVDAQLSAATGSTPARIGMIDTSGNFYVKEGLYGGWVLENGSVSKAALSGNLIAVIINGTLLVKQGTLDAGWVTENGSVAQTAVWSGV